MAITLIAEPKTSINVQVRAHKYYLAAVSDTFKSLFFGHEEGSHSGHTDEALDYCDNNLCEGSVGIQKFKKRSEETIELKECGGELKAVSKQICDRGGEEEEQHVKQTGVEDITVVCSSVGAFQVSFFLCSFRLMVPYFNSMPLRFLALSNLFCNCV